MCRHFAKSLLRQPGERWFRPATPKRWRARFMICSAIPISWRRYLQLRARRRKGSAGSTLLKGISGFSRRLRKCIREPEGRKCKDEQDQGGRAAVDAGAAARALLLHEAHQDARGAAGESLPTDKGRWRALQIAGSGS